MRSWVQDLQKKMRFGISHQIPGLRRFYLTIRTNLTWFSVSEVFPLLVEFKL